jgi:diguanylate cyclase (GGDEF)-like protein/PAS domain S-box-containing protein
MATRSDDAQMSSSNDLRRQPREEEILRATFDTVDDLVVGCDASGSITLINPAMRRFAALASDELVARSRVPKGDTSAQDATRVVGSDELLTRVLAGEVLSKLEVSLESSAGLRRNMLATGHRLLDADGTVLGAVVLWHDVTAQKDSEARLSFQNLHDALTRLPNRDLFAERVKTALTRAARYHWSTAVLAINLDHFSHTANRVGKGASDQVLEEVARRLTTYLRPYDSVATTVDTAARSGGDQFLLLCEDVGDGSAAETIAERVHKALHAPMHIGGEILSITAGIGIAVAAETSQDPDALILEALTAMRVAKHEGVGRHQRFAPEMDAQLQSRIDDEQGLRRALADDEFRLVYQPKISLITDDITGVEALLRWHDPSRGVIPPLNFIPLAEETGLIIPIGRWVLEQVCRDAQKWATILPGDQPLSISVNVSPRQFERGLVRTFSSIIGESGIEPASICVEVTESMVMHDAELAIATLQDLKALGLRISIDDFGTGFSSLAYLKRFPLDEIKVDKSFVDGLGVDPEATAIVAAVMGMAHALDLHVVAEGVETADQLSRLRTLGCDEAQGYYFARPTTVESIDVLLAAGIFAPGPGADRASPALGIQALRSRKVLVVDDAADVRVLARSSLTAVGFEVQEADSGEVALRIAQQFAPDCVVLDVNLPGISGIDVCRILREDVNNDAITIVMLTGDAEPAEKVLAFSYKADDYMVKPFSPRDLVGRVTASMRRRNEMLATLTA